jgi:hypothetical protein
VPKMVIWLALFDYMEGELELENGLAWKERV